MKLTALNASVALLVLTSAAARAATEERIQKRFAVQPGGTVAVDVEFGAIAVSTNATSEVVVEAWRKIGRSKKADEEAYLREHPVTFSQEGSTVTIRCQGENKRSWWSRGKQQNEATYTLTVPAKFNAQLKTGGGGIEVVDLTGEVRAATGGGELSFARLHGPLDGNTGGGGVEAEDCHGPLKLRTGGGSLEVSGSSGSLDGKTGGGSVSVKGFQGPAHVSSGGGGVTIEKVSGAVDASTGGGSITAVLPGQLSDTVKLSTGGGGINLSVTGDAAFNLDAKTGGGRVTTGLPVTVVGKMEEGRLEGPVNGGGKPVQLRCGSGAIRLKKL